MEAEKSENYVGHKEPVILILPGMKRQWVFSKGKGWIEYILPKVKPKNIDETEIQCQLEGKIKKKKWWQIWKKN